MFFHRVELEECLEDGGTSGHNIQGKEERLP